MKKDINLEKDALDVLKGFKKEKMDIDIKKEELEKEIAKLIEEEYKNKQTFLSAYLSNPRKVSSKIIRKMKVVPIDIKRIIFNFVKELSTEKSDNYAA